MERTEKLDLLKQVEAINSRKVEMTDPDNIAKADAEISQLVAKIKGKPVLIPDAGPNYEAAAMINVFKASKEELAAAIALLEAGAADGSMPQKFQLQLDTMKEVFANRFNEEEKPPARETGFGGTDTEAMVAALKSLGLSVQEALMGNEITTKAGDYSYSITPMGGGKYKVVGNGINVGTYNLASVVDRVKRAVDTQALEPDPVVSSQWDLKSRNALLDYIWTNANEDQKGKVAGKKALLMLREDGTTLVALDDLTDPEIFRKIGTNKYLVANHAIKNGWTLSKGMIDTAYKFIDRVKFSSTTIETESLEALKKATQEVENMIESGKDDRFLKNEIFLYESAINSAKRAIDKAEAAEVANSNLTASIAEMIAPYGFGDVYIANDGSISYDREFGNTYTLNVTFEPLNDGVHVAVSTSNAYDSSDSQTIIFAKYTNIELALKEAEDAIKKTLNSSNGSRTPASNEKTPEQEAMIKQIELEQALEAVLLNEKNIRNSLAESQGLTLIAGDLLPESIRTNDQYSAASKASAIALKKLQAFNKGNQSLNKKWAKERRAEFGMGSQAIEKYATKLLGFNPYEKGLSEQDEYDALPADIKALVDSFSERLADDPDAVTELRSAANAIGWDFDVDADSSPMNYRRIAVDADTGSDDAAETAQTFEERLAALKVQPIDDVEEFNNALNELADELEAAGLMEQYDDDLNEIGDRIDAAISEMGA